MPILHLKKLHGCISDSTLLRLGLSAGPGYRICVLEQVEGSVRCRNSAWSPTGLCHHCRTWGRGVDQGSGRCSRLLYRDTTVRLKAFAECVGQRRNHPLASLQSYAVLRDYLKFILLFTLLLRVLFGVFLFILRSCSYGYTPHLKQKSVRTILLKSVSYKFRQSLLRLYCT